MTVPNCARVLLFAELVGGIWPSPSTQLRFLLPWQSADVRIVDGALFRQASRAAIRRTADVAVFQRLEVTRAENEEVLQSLQRNGMPIVIDLDDDFFSLQGIQDHEAALIPDETLQSLHTGLSLADEIWVASEAMLSSYARFGTRVRRRASLPPPLPKVGPSSAAGALRVLYFGTQTHHRDWQLVQAVIAELVETKVISCTLVGLNPSRVPGGVRSEPVPTGAISRYVAFMQYVCQQGPFDVGIAPLRADEFSAGKSGLKLLEYLELGLIPMASPVGPYAWLRDIDPRLVPDSATQWRSAFLALASMSSDQREEIYTAVCLAADLPRRRREQLERDIEVIKALAAASPGCGPT